MREAALAALNYKAKAISNLKLTGTGKSTKSQKQKRTGNCRSFDCGSRLASRGKQKSASLGSG
jgi:hypothetical protein